MDTETVISVTNVSKRYRLGVIGGATLSDDLKVWWARMRGKPNPMIPLGSDMGSNREGNHFWALRDVDFEVEQGEILGVIGKNGAGKSTLLKLLSQITGPTTGAIKIKGRTASLLEVGTGFHPELTGRENIFLNGAILGMNKTEISKKLEEIIDFSGIEHHIDTPVKRYSSGMKVRLGFAVAAHLEPEILIIDEVLAVGDAEFQKKCLGKMKDVAGSGRTIIFVSHNMSAVQSLCTRTIWMVDGTVQENGDTFEVVKNYLKAYSFKKDKVAWGEGQEKPGTNEVRLNSVSVVAKDHDTELITMNDPFNIKVEFENISISDGDLNIGIHVTNEQEVLAFASSFMEHRTGGSVHKTGNFVCSCAVPGNLLNSGTYRVVVLFFRKSKVLFKVEDTILFEVNEPERKGAWFGKKKGVFRPKLDWELMAEVVDPHMPG